MIPLIKIELDQATKDAVMAVLDSGIIAQGPRTKEFEDKFAEYCGAKYAVATNSGTSALHAALYGIGVKKGDEVITTPFTFVASSNSIAMQNAKPVFVDIKEDTFNLDPSLVEAAITDKTKAIIAVDLFGQIFDYSAIKAIADKHDIKIVEDAAQAVGAKLDGKKAGTIGDVSTFSFYATKNLMCGEGGMITTDNEEVAELAKRFRHHGQSEQTRYQYYDLGYNYRMTDLHAVIGLNQLAKIDDFNEKRQANAKKLSEGLSKLTEVTVPKIKDGAFHVFHQYTIRVSADKRDKVIEHLKKNEIGCAVFYPKPLHLHPFYEEMGYSEGDFPVAERVAKEVISLPIHPNLSDSDIDTIIKVLGEVLE